MVGQTLRCLINEQHSQTKVEACKGAEPEAN